MGEYSSDIIVDFSSHNEKDLFDSSYEKRDVVADSNLRSNKVVDKVHVFNYSTQACTGSASYFDKALELAKGQENIVSSSPISCVSLDSLGCADINIIGPIYIHVNTTSASTVSRRKVPKSLKFHHMLELSRMLGNKNSHLNSKLKRKGKLCLQPIGVRGPTTRKLVLTSSDSGFYVPLSGNCILHGDQFDFSSICKTNDR